MAKRNLKVDCLSVSSIRQLRKYLESYQKSLTGKCETLVRRLAEHGIQTAEFYAGEYGRYISFTMQTKPTADGCSGVMLATNTGLIRSEWRTKEGVKSVDISPLLMVEFGSGLRAENPADVPGVGTGTFPGQTHATDPDGWWYLDLNGEWHHSYGISPMSPMYHAAEKMQEIIVQTAKEVFGG